MPGLAYAANPSAPFSDQVVPAASNRHRLRHRPSHYTGSIPAAATQAGFTHCAANYDFTQTQSFTDSVGTHQWSNLSSWLSCSGSTSAPYLFDYVIGSDSVPCDTSHQNVTTVNGVQVLQLTYAVADQSAAHYINQLRSINPVSSLNVSNPWQEEWYSEFVMQFNNTSPCGSNFCIAFNISTFTSVQGNPCFFATDQEWDSGATGTGTGFALYNFPCGTSNFENLGASPVDGAISTNVTTWGSLVTADNVSTAAANNFWGSGAISGLPGSAFLSSVSKTVVPPATNPVFHNPLYFYISEGPNGSTSNWTLTHVTNIQRITIWECPGYQSGGCFNNRVITSAP